MVGFFERGGIVETSVPKNGKTVSFIHDPEALACLLHDIVARAEQQNGILTLNEISQLSWKLGYRGSLPTVRTLLLMHRFLCEHEACDTFCLREENRIAIEAFFREHEAVFASVRLSESEERALFGRLSDYGTDAERILSRVMMHLSYILKELTLLRDAGPQINAALADAEMMHCLALERIMWFMTMYDSVTKECDHVLETHGMHSREFRQALLRYLKTHRKYLDVLYDAEVENARFSTAVRDKEILEFLKPIHEFFNRFATVFLTKV